MATYFDALGLDRSTATPADAKQAFRGLASELHPDRSPEDAELFKLISAAYAELKDDDKLENAKYGFSKGYSTWKKDWDALVHPKKPQAKKRGSYDHDEMMDYLNDLIFRQDMQRKAAKDYKEAAEREAAAREAAKKAEDKADHWSWKQGRKAGESYDDFMARKVKEEQDRFKRYDQEAAARRNAKNAKREAGQCGHETKSGPCVRPAGHTPNGHMSAKVRDQKRANQRAKQASQS